MGRTEDLEIKGWHRSFLNKFLEHQFLRSVTVLIEVILDLLNIKDIELVLAVLILLGWRLRVILLLHHSILVLIWVWLERGIVRAAVARSVLVLTVGGSIRLIVVLPLLVPLVFEHLLHLFPHWLGQVAI